MSPTKPDETRDGVPLTNLDQPLFDSVTVTKRELVDYLDGVSERILPELEDRTLSVIRVHRGAEAFMQKNVPKYTPKWVETVRLWAETSKRDVTYALCNDRRTLLWFANQRAIEYHPALVRAAHLDRMTHLILDLDPPEGESFPKAVQAARLVHQVLDDVGLAGAVKTSGAKGVHVFVPIDDQTPIDQVAAATHAVAVRAAALDPSLATTEFVKDDRGGRVFVDSTRVGSGTVVAAYSPRVRPGVPVSFPVGWDDLDAVTPKDFTVLTALGHLGDRDPWAEQMPAPQAIPAELIDEGAAIPVGRVAAMHEGKRRAAKVRQGDVMARPVRLSFTDHVRLLPGLASGDFVGVMQHLHERYGPVVDLGYGSSRAVLVFGAEANEHVLSKAADCFEWGEAMQALVAVDGPTALVVSDGDDHKRRRRLVQPAFSIKRIGAHLGLVVTEVDRALAGWRPGVQLDAADSLREAIRRIVVRALFGEELGAEADRFGALLEPGLRYVQKMPQQRFEHDLRINPYARVQRSNRAADALVLEEVARRRAAGIDADAHPDTLTALLAGVDGEALTDAELVDQVRSLMAAGFDTTSGAAAWLVLELGRNPGALADLRAEVDAVLGDRAPTIDDLRAMPLSLGAVHEVLRLWPPGPAAPRRSIAPSELHGMTIPAGRMVLYSAYVTGRLAELWPDPERFDPARWVPGAPEPAPYAFVPFGGGYRRCIGFALATLELQVMAIRLAQQVEWRNRTAKVRPTGIATLTPKGGVPIEVTARR